jgi:hypothetical protein
VTCRTEKLVAELLLRKNGYLHIAKDGKAREDIGDLKGPGNSPAANLIRRQSADIFIVKNNFAAVRMQLPGYKIKQGRFAGAIRSYHRDQLTLLDREIGAVYSLEVVK